jgi:hypothetical protein
MAGNRYRLLQQGAEFFFHQSAVFRFLKHITMEAIAGRKVD